MIQYRTIRYMVSRFFLGFILLFLLLSFMPHTLGEVDATHCTAPRPGSAPVLTSAVSHDRSVTLTWTVAQDPVTQYVVAYGTSRDEIEYGAPNIGDRQTSSFTVGELKNGVKYYFRVRAVNGCKPGKFSNKLSAIAGGEQFLGKVSDVTKTISRGPNLSIYKPVLGASAAAIAKPTEKKKEPVIVQNSSLIKCATSCVSWPLLAGEVLLLVIYFYFTHRFRIISPIFSIIIPAITYLVFLGVYGACPLKDFSCKYFLPLSILVFVLAVLMRKHKFLKGELLQKT